MNRSKPGRLGCATGASPVDTVDDWPGRSGPPQAVTMRVSTINASLAVGKSVTSLLKCSIVEITVSNTGWLAMKESTIDQVTCVQTEAAYHC